MMRSSGLAIYACHLDSKCTVRIFPKKYRVRDDSLYPDKRILYIPTLNGLSFSGRVVRLDCRAYFIDGEPSTHVLNHNRDGSIRQTYMQLKLTDA